VLSVSGQAGSSFTSELTLANRGSADATVELVYTAAFGGGSGTGTDTLQARRQKTVPDAIEYLRTLGVPIPGTGDRGGTVAVKFFGLSSPTAGAASVRTTTGVPRGRAGLSYPAVPPAGLTGPVYLCGLRQNQEDRSHLALMNTGSEGAGDVTLRVTVFSGDTDVSTRLNDVTLSPGAFTQIPEVLLSAGLAISNGFVRVERAGGDAPFYAYAVVNDQATSDGSFLPPLLASSVAGRDGLTLPVAVEAGPFTTELVLTNFAGGPKSVRLAFVGDATATTELALRPREQRVIPSFFEFLRDQGALDATRSGLAGAVFATVPEGDVGGLAVGARTSAAGDGGRYGLFYTAAPAGGAARRSAWLHGLRQDAESRTNLALVVTGETDDEPDTLRLELFDGATGARAATVDVTLGARRWTQLSSILSAYAPAVTNGYARVTRIGGRNPFLCYAVVHDGAGPGQRSDDGAFVAMDLADDSGAATPTLGVSPAALDFGDVALGTTRDLSVTVRNDGEGILSGSATTTGAPFTLATGSPFRVEAGRSATVTVRYTAADPITQSGTLSITSNGGSAAVPLRGSGAGTPAPELSVTPAAVDLGDVTVGLAREAPLTLRNAGSAPLRVSSLSFSNPRFSAGISTALTLDAGAAYTLAIRFEPTVAANETGDLTIVSNDPRRPTLTVPLAGRGVAGPTSDVELTTDDGSLETGVAEDGLIVLNRLTPPRYPATLKRIRIFFFPFPGYLDPTSATVQLVVMPEPSGAGRPVGALSYAAPVQLPTIPPGGTFVDFPVANGATIPSGDLYVGFAASDPAAGVVFAADTSGPPQRRAFFSNDSGESFQGPLGPNIMIRAVVTVPGDRPAELGSQERPAPAVH